MGNENQTGHVKKYSFRGNKYTGDIVDGKPHGKGTLVFIRRPPSMYEDNDERWEQHTGTWEHGNLHGQCKTLYDDGSILTATWRHGRLTTKMTVLDKKDREYVGSWDWIRARRHGRGTMTWPDGRKYVGNWNSNTMYGRGTMTWPDGRKYVGVWEDDKMHGEGLMIEGNVRSHGKFRDGEKHGVFHVSEDGQPPEQKHFVFGEPLEGSVHKEGKLRGSGHEEGSPEYNAS